MAKNKKSKDCSSNNKRRLIWYSVSAAGLGLRGFATIALLAIAMMLCSIKKESKAFNNCVEEIQNSGKSISEAVRYCNGGDPR